MTFEIFHALPLTIALDNVTYGHVIVRKQKVENLQSK
jgi:hypothetical protein